MKSCLEGGAAKKKESIPQEEKEKKLLRGKIKCPNCGQLEHRKASPKCPLNGSKKRQAQFASNLLCSFKCPSIGPIKAVFYFIMFFSFFQEKETSKKCHKTMVSKKYGRITYTSG
jgi:hypothetical protein